MKVRDAMTPSVYTISPDDTICKGAEIMATLDAGVIPVAENDRLVGMITDRDIAVRAVARGRGPDTKIREVMSPEVKYCFDDQEIDEIVQNMADIQIRRLPVMNRDKRLVGIIALGDIAMSEDEEDVGRALCGISQPNSAYSHL